MNVKDLVVREFDRVSDAERLRLMQAFFHITEPKLRREMIALAEKLATHCGARPDAASPQRDNKPAK